MIFSLIFHERLYIVYTENRQKHSYGGDSVKTTADAVIFTRAICAAGVTKQP